jgi:phosphoribosylamine--glycine ligase
VVLEDFLDGYECSVLALCDGQRVVPLVPAQDYKRVGDGDTGPNTGGMGARAPLTQFSADDLAGVVSTILEPTVAALVARGIDFRGVLYAGIMMTSSGPVLLEYNVRFGDPETQVVLPLWGQGLVEILLQCARGELVDAPSFRDAAAVTIVLASPGYPDAPRTGLPIYGLNARGQLDAVAEGVHVFHAGTTRDADGVFHTSGGRVLSVTAVAADHATARQHAYDAARQISFEGCVMRSDIATKEIA